MTLGYVFFILFWTIYKINSGFGWRSLSVYSGSSAEVHEQLVTYNQELHYYQHAGAEIAWNMSLGGNPNSWVKNQDLAVKTHTWNNRWCQKFLLIVNQPGIYISLRDARQIYLICRGPRFTSFQLSNVISILTEMSKIYSNKKVFSMQMEPDLNNFMEKTRDEPLLRSAWTQWHQSIGNDIKPLYINLIQRLNQGARNAGHSDMGDIWRQDTEIPELRGVVLKLYSEVKYLYSLLHSYVRFKLSTFYKLEINSTIPVHLLGNMWAQKWDSLFDILDLEFSEGHNSIVYDKNERTGMEDKENENPLITEYIARREGNGNNATIIDVVHTTEDLFVSMGLPKLPQKFYKASYFTKDPKFPSKNCHGTAANMFGDGATFHNVPPRVFPHISDSDSDWDTDTDTDTDENPSSGGVPHGDYRIMMCANEKLADTDLITLTHEMGHIYYFMAYSQLEPIFQDGANSAFHESVGDSVTYGLNSDSHKRSPNNSLRIKTLLKTALSRLPQIGFGLVMELWRWHVFENENSPETWNSYWWKLHGEFLGLSPPRGYVTNGLDATGKFHIIDNTPYIRYFIASFLQIQFFEAYCQGQDIHECELWGNKLAGIKLWDMMKKGTSEHWSVVLKELTGSDMISSLPLLRYFDPLKTWLELQIEKNDLHVGW